MDSVFSEDRFKGGFPSAARPQASGVGASGSRARSGEGRAAVGKPHGGGAGTAGGASTTRDAYRQELESHLSGIDVSKGVTYTEKMPSGADVVVEVIRQQNFLRDARRMLEQAGTPQESGASADDHTSKPSPGRRK